MDGIIGGEPALGALRPDTGDVLPDLTTLIRSLGRGRRPAPEAFLGLAAAALAEAGSLVQPAAVWAEVEADGVAETLLPGIAEAHLAGIRALIPVVCTIGEALDAQAHRLFAEQEYTRGYLLDQAGVLAVARVAQHVADLLRAERHAARWAPGDDDDRTMEAQRMLFALLPTEEIGVRLSEQYMMRPAKSLSFVLLVGSGAAGLQCLGSCRRCLWNGGCEKQYKGAPRRVR